MFTAIVVVNGCFAVFTQCWCVVSIISGLIVGHSRCIMVVCTVWGCGGEHNVVYVFVVGCGWWVV